MDETAPRESIWTPRLLGLANRRLDLALTLLAVALLAASRLLLLADGPWEQDEAIFARSVLELAPKQNFPHPPFFPGWIGIGAALTPLAGEPLRALQLASGVASVLCLWPLAALGRRAATPLLAFLCALGVQFLPGTWVFAVRGFSDTASALLALLATALLLQGLGGERFFGFSALIAASFLVRPVLAPVLLLVWLAGARQVRRLRLIAAGAALGVLMVAAAFRPFVNAAGGLDEFVAMFAAHGREHLGAVGAAGVTLAGLGPVVGFGGVVASALAALAGAVGLAVWKRRQGRASAALYASVLGLMVVLLLFAHVPTFPRYSVPLLLAVAPLAAAALSSLPALAGPAVALSLSGLSAALWLPLLVEQHTTRLPMWAAAVAAGETARAAPVPTQVLGGRGGWAFAAYCDTLMHRDGGAGNVPRAGRWTLPFSGDPAAPHWLVVTEDYEGALPWQGAREVASFSGVSARAERISQHRFLSAVVVADLALQRGQWWVAKKDGAGHLFAWSSKGTALILPALARGDRLLLAVRPAAGGKPLRVNVNRRVSFALPGVDRVVSERVPPAAVLTDRPNVVYFDRDEAYPPGGRDNRPLAVAVYPPEVLRDDRFDLPFAEVSRFDDVGVRVQGFYGKETFRGGVQGRWSEPDAAIELPAATTGVVTLTLLAPRPGETRVEVLAGGTRLAGPWLVPTVPVAFSFTLPPATAAAGQRRLELRTNPYATPALPDRPSRALGVVVSSLAVAPAP